MTTLRVPHQKVLHGRPSIVDLRRVNISYILSNHGQKESKRFKHHITRHRLAIKISTLPDFVGLTTVREKGRWAPHCPSSNKNCVKVCSFTHFLATFCSPGAFGSGRFIRFGGLLDTCWDLERTHELYDFSQSWGDSWSSRLFSWECWEGPRMKKWPANNKNTWVLGRLAQTFFFLVRCKEVEDRFCGWDTFHVSCEGN